nr:MAG TPA: hypothetical protein [Caudoviricetes sp.]DAP05559.1 MAG TPA: hypothetical protein [Caudoviricetes sp.]DAS46829.1 MAG TPA: hypothetical protein [Caudoviricetes sp.]
MGRRNLKGYRRCIRAYRDTLFLFIYADKFRF